MSPVGRAWRLLLHAPADGAWNMAVDEAILERHVAFPLEPPTLRLYAWRPPALSLGRNQPAPGSFDATFLREQGIHLVRRPTGGLAVLHEHERTYAVIGSLRRVPFANGVVATYRRIAEALAEALGALGVGVTAVDRRPGPAGPRPTGPGCFDAVSLHEITAGGRKLVGSAQLRRRGAFLQHGSILLEADAARAAAAVGGSPPGDRFTDLRRESGRAVDPREVDRALVEAFRRRFGTHLEPGALSEAERRCATRLRCWKYGSAAWTLEGRLGPRELRWGPPVA